MADLLRQCALNFAAALCFSVIFNIGRRFIPYAALGGGLTWLVYLLMTQTGSHLAPYLAASMFAAAYAEALSRVLKTPVTTFVIVAIIPLVPGGAMYNTMLMIVRRQYDTALTTGIDTLSIAGVIAVGIIFVSSAVRLMKFRRVAK